jgi:transposase
MATDESSNTTTTPQMGQAEMSALATRLRSRAESVLFRDQPEQARDLRSAAVLIDELVRLRAEIRRLADEVRNEVEEQHLREILGGVYGRP